MFHIYRVGLGVCRSCRAAPSSPYVYETSRYEVCHEVCHEVGVIKWVRYNFWKANPLKFGRAKNVQNAAQFLTTFDFDREYLRNGSTYRKSEEYFYELQPLPRWVKKIRWTLVHKQKRYSCSYWPIQADIFGRQHFGAWGVLPPRIFTRVTDWPSLASAHQNWDGSPNKKLIVTV